ncbi:unnamed protein product [Discula destructiva]
MSRYGDERHGGREDRKRTASRSPSPTRKRRPLAADYFEADDRRRHDDHSRRRKHHHHHHHHHHKHSHRHDASSSSKRVGRAPAELPFKARLLSYKHDFDAFAPLFANYLDIQKGKDFYDLDEYEQKGRWKSFVHKWNRGELAEGWYDPEMFERIAKEAPPRPDTARRETSVAMDSRGEDLELEAQDAVNEEEARRPRRVARSDGEEEEEEEEDDDDDDYGPPPPPGATSFSRKGPGIPSLSDLALQREAAAEDRLNHVTDLRLARKADRTAQKEALDELVPRAEPGTRERKLEKKAAVNEKMRSFRDRGDAVQEVDDGELMGGGDGVEDFKKAVASQQRKKTERELRREEEARARFEEREKKLKEWREREEEKMRGLKELAKARFG